MGRDTHISIHALREECDSIGDGLASVEDDFNPRTPRGVRQQVDRGMNTLTSFQSTHSARSATDPHARSLDMARISIHALREECDLAELREEIKAAKFQSTHSARSATKDDKSHGALGVISIHALREECD